MAKDKEAKMEKEREERVSCRSPAVFPFTWVVLVVHRMGVCRCSGMRRRTGAVKGTQSWPWRRVPNGMAPWLAPQEPCRLLLSC